jgi:hypothetical protein
MQKAKCYVSSTQVAILYRTVKSDDPRFSMGRNKEKNLPGLSTYSIDFLLLLSVLVEEFKKYSTFYVEKF